MLSKSFAKAFVFVDVVIVDKQEILGNKRTGQKNGLDSSGETVLEKFLIRCVLDSVFIFSVARKDYDQFCFRFSAVGA